MGKITESCGKLWKVVENYGKPWKTDHEIYTNVGDFMEFHLPIAMFDCDAVLPAELFNKSKAKYDIIHTQATGS